MASYVEHSRTQSSSSSAYGRNMANSNSMSSVNTSGSGANNNQPIEQDVIIRYHRGFCSVLGLAITPGYPAIDPVASGNNKARQKLRRLGDNHFNELATDVHDELERRLDPGPKPEHLTFREDMHPKRNMARQKLCVLTETRFKDLCTDILCEIETRYPYAIPPEVSQSDHEVHESNEGYHEYHDHNGNEYDYGHEPLPPHPEPLESYPQESHEQESYPQESHPQESYPQEPLPQESYPQEPHPQESHPQGSQESQHNGHSPQFYDEHSGDTAVPNYQGENELDELNFNPMDESKHVESHNYNGSFDGNVDDDINDQPITNQPISQSLKQTTIVPTKSTLAEESDDDDSEEEEIFTKRSTRRSSMFESSIQLDSIAEEDRPLGNEEDTGLTRQHTISQSWRHTRGISASSSSGLQRYGSRDLTGSIGSIGQITPPESASVTPFFDDEKVTHSHTSGIVGIGTDDIHESIRERDEQIKMLVDEGSRMDDTINKLEAQLAESEELKNNLVSENGRLHETIGDLEMEKERLNRELRESKDAHEGDVTKYLDVIRETEQRLADVQQEHLTLQKNHSEHEERSAELDKQVVGLQTTISRHEETISNLRSEQQQQQQTRALEAPGDPEMVEKYEKLRKDHSKLSKELEQQQKVTDQVRQEASAFLEEMRTLASSQSSWENVEALNLEVQKLKLEVQDWKSRYLRTKNNLKSARSSMYMSRASNVFQPSPPPIEEDSPYYDAEDGKIRTSSVTKFQVAMDEFLVKSRTDAGNLLDNLHNLVVATRVVSQDITESSSEAIDGERQSQIAQCTSLVSNTANSLIATTRNHLTSGGLAPISVLDATAADLSSAVIELIKVAKVRPGGEESIAIEPRPDSAEFEEQHSPDVPKDFYNDGYQRNPHDLTTHRDDEGDSTDYETTTASTNVYNQPSQTTENSVGGGKAMHSRTRSSRILDEEEAAADHEIRVLRKRFASNYSDSNLIQNFDIEDPDNTVAELQEYLEEQTFGVIEAVQNLLTGIKNNATMGEIRPYLETITAVLDQMVEATGTSMSQTRNWKLKDKGKYILDLLADCAVRLHNLKVDCGALDDSKNPDKHLKHRFAALTYDITKRTNELVKTVEVVSLTAEVQEIDQKLGVHNQI